MFHFVLFHHESHGAIYNVLIIGSGRGVYRSQEVSLVEIVIRMVKKIEDYIRDGVK